MASRSFLPRMQSRIRDFRLLAPLAWRRLPGLVADRWHVEAREGASGHYIAPDPRLVIFLGDSPPPMRLRLSDGGPEFAAPRALFVPAGRPLWSRMTATAELCHLDLHLEAGHPGRSLTLPEDTCPLPESEDSTTLARLAAGEVAQSRRGDAYLDGLIQALLAEMLGSEPAPQRGGLAPWQVAACEAHLRANLSRSIPVGELAAICGLSESWFAHGFRQTLSQTPQRWQLGLRLVEAKALMADPARPLAEIAQATGFADQAHFSRAFRQAFGLPPSTWRRQFPGSRTNRNSLVQDGDPVSQVKD